jgi:hypothetical protein
MEQRVFDYSLVWVGVLEKRNQMEGCQVYVKIDETANQDGA